MEISKLYFLLILLLCCNSSCWVATFLNHHSSLTLSSCPCYASAPGDFFLFNCPNTEDLTLSLSLLWRLSFFSFMMFLPSLDLPSDTHIIFSYILTYIYFSYFSFHNNIFFLQTKLQFLVGKDDILFPDPGQCHNDNYLLN